MLLLIHLYILEILPDSFYEGITGKCGTQSVSVNYTL